MNNNLDPPTDSENVALTFLQREGVELFKARQFKSCEIAAGMELSVCEKEGRDPVWHGLC